MPMFDLSSISRELTSTHLFDLELTPGTPHVLSRDGTEARVVVPIVDGRFTGPELAGKVVRGDDWLALGGDGIHRLNVRLVLETNGGDLVLMRYKGVRHGPEDVMDRLCPPARPSTRPPTTCVLPPSSKPGPRPACGSTALSPSASAPGHRTGCTTSSIRSSDDISRDQGSRQSRLLIFYLNITGTAEAIQVYKSVCITAPGYLSHELRSADQPMD